MILKQHDRGHTKPSYRGQKIQISSLSVCWKIPWLVVPREGSKSQAPFQLRSRSSFFEENGFVAQRSLEAIWFTAATFPWSLCPPFRRKIIRLKMDCSLCHPWQCWCCGEPRARPQCDACEPTWVGWNCFSCGRKSWQGWSWSYHWLEYRFSTLDVLRDQEGRWLSEVSKASRKTAICLCNLCDHMCQNHCRKSWISPEEFVVNCKIYWLTSYWNMVAAHNLDDSLDFYTRVHGCQAKVDFTLTCLVWWKLFRHRSCG